MIGLEPGASSLGWATYGSRSQATVGQQDLTLVTEHSGWQVSSLFSSPVQIALFTGVDTATSSANRTKRELNFPFTATYSQTPQTMAVADLTLVCDFYHTVGGVLSPSIMPLSRCKSLSPQSWYSPAKRQ